MSAIPVRVRPSLSMNIAQTVMTALLLKPANASSGVTWPAMASAPSTISATTSMRITSLMNRISDTIRIPRTIAMSGVIGDSCRAPGRAAPRLYMISIDDYQPRAARRSRRIRLNGIDCAVHEWGAASAPLLIYLHGFADTGSCFQFVADELAGTYRIVAPDWRGFGASEHVAGGYYFPDYIADLDALLARYSPRRPARLIGHSMGGNVAGLFAGAFPERVAAFANIEGFGLADSEPGDAPARYRDWVTSRHDDASWSRNASFDALAMRLCKRHPRLTPAKAAFVAKEWAEAAGDWHSPACRSASQAAEPGSLPACGGGRLLGTGHGAGPLHCRGAQPVS